MAHQHGTGHRHDHAHAAGEGDDAGLAELLELDAEVLSEYHSEVYDWVRESAADRPRRRLLDLGSGPGVGTLALAERFPSADVTAVDVSASFLERLRAKAHDRGLADRVHTVEADLDLGWPAIDQVDLVWAGNSMHHFADPDRVLAQVFAALNPGGLVVITEMDGMPRFLPEEVGYGLEARLRSAAADDMAEELPQFDTDWAERLGQAGFTLDSERRFAIELTPPLPAAAGRYAQATLRRTRSRVAERISADDLARLDSLIDPHTPDSVLRGNHLTIQTTRTTWIAHRSA